MPSDRSYCAVRRWPGILCTALTISLLVFAGTASDARTRVDLGNNIRHSNKTLLIQRKMFVNSLRNLISVTACQGGHYGQAIIARRVLGANRTVDTTASTQAKGWSPSRSTSGCFNRYSIYTQNRYALGVSAKRDGMRFGDDLLASPSRSLL